MDNDFQELTKKERRELRRQERMEESSSMRRKNTARKFGIWGGVLLVIGTVLYGIVQLGSNANNVGQGSLATAVSAVDWSKGNPESPIILVEYGDFQCPACAAYHPMIDQLVKQRGNDFRFVYRHFPLKSIHPNADGASRASEAAGMQGKFWEMYDIIYQRQTSWSNLGRGTVEETFIGYAKELGLNEEQFKKDMASDAVKDKVDNQLKDGTASGVSSTPTLFLNGEKIANPRSYEEFIQVIFSANTSPEPSATP